MPKPAYVSRINQIDAAQLDEEIYKILRGQAKEVTKHCPPGKVDKWQPEIDVLLKFLIWYFSLRNGNVTFGQQLLNLHYTNLNKRKSILYLVLTVLPKYVQEKLAYNTRIVSDEQLNRRLKSLVGNVANVLSLLEFINLLIFLNRGFQPQLIERLLGIWSQSVTTHKPRNIGYSYMTRELLWHCLIELFSMGLPMINFHYLKQVFVRFWLRRRRKNLVRSFPVMTERTKCAYCGDTPILPSHAGCEHIFCYYCLKAHFTAMNSFQCPECFSELHSVDMQQYVVAPSIADQKSDLE